MCPLARTDQVTRSDEPGAAQELECPELPSIHALADGELTAREAADARVHLARCARCRSELAFLAQLALALARGVAALDAPGSPRARGAIAAVAVLGGRAAIRRPS